jgi:CheY-like chemotaxis protein
MNKALRVLIVDDQRRARQSVKALLATKFQPIEMREAANGSEAVRRVEEWLPDIVLMDARMPEMDGVQATRVIKTRWPLIRVIILSMYAGEAIWAAAADEFIMKGEPPERLLAALVAAANSIKASSDPDKSSL